MKDTENVSEVTTFRGHDTSLCQVLSTAYAAVQLSLRLISTSLLWHIPERIYRRLWHI